MTLVLHDISPDLAAIIEKRAAEHGSSLAQAAVQLLERGAGLGKERQASSRQHGLARFAGLWTAEEAAEFDGVLAEQRQIDPDLWR